MTPAASCAAFELCPVPTTPASPPAGNATSAFSVQPITPKRNPRPRPRSPSISGSGPPVLVLASAPKTKPPVKPNPSAWIAVRLSASWSLSRSTSVMVPAPWWLSRVPHSHGAPNYAVGGRGDSSALGDACTVHQSRVRLDFPPLVIPRRPSAYAGAGCGRGDDHRVVPANAGTQRLSGPFSDNRHRHQ